MSDISVFTLPSLSQSSLGLPDGCGFFALWNCLCFVRDDDSIRLDPSRFLQKYERWSSYLKLGERREKDLSVGLLLELTCHDTQLRTASQHDLVLLPLGYNILALGSEAVIDLETKLKNFATGTLDKCAIISSIPGHYVSFLISKNSRSDQIRIALCDSLNSMSVAQVSAQLQLITGALQHFFDHSGSNSFSLRGEYLRQVMTRFVADSQDHIKKYGLSSWQRKIIPHDFKFDGVILKQAIQIIRVAYELGVNISDYLDDHDRAFLRDLCERERGESYEKFLLLMLLGDVPYQKDMIDCACLPALNFEEEEQKPLPLAKIDIREEGNFISLERMRRDSPKTKKSLLRGKMKEKVKVKTKTKISTKQTSPSLSTPKIPVFKRSGKVFGF
jgi:hypothetical protein